MKSGKSDRVHDGSTNPKWIKLSVIRDRPIKVLHVFRGSEYRLVHATLNTITYLRKDIVYAPR